jgi:hypothetical protein
MRDRQSPFFPLAPTLALALALALALTVTGACGSATPPAPELCNGSAENCQRRYDQVTFSATHNAFSYAAGGPVKYLFPNQDLPIADQLRRGIRGFGIRPCPYYGDDPAESARVYVTHNFDLKGLLGAEPLVDVLNTVRVFLEQNPSEVVTLFAESAVSPAAIADTFAAAGLVPYLYVHDRAQGFPTLAQMSQRNTRLVVFNDSRDPARPPWQHYLYELIVDTDYNITDAAQFKCDFYRGKGENPLYFINHFVYSALSDKVLVPDPQLAAQANQPALIVERAKSCWQKTGRIPNFLYVDWYGQGDVVGAMQTLNELPR